MGEITEGRKGKKILPKSRRGFKKWTKINVQFSKPRVFWRQLVLKTVLEHNAVKCNIQYFRRDHNFVSINYFLIKKVFRSFFCC